MRKILFAVIASIAMLTASNASAQCCCAGAAETTPVARYGWLQVKGTALCSEQGDSVQLRGVSFGWHNMWPRFYNRTNVKYFAREWKASIVRASMGLSLDEKCFDVDREGGYAAVDSVVSGAVEAGVYVIIDFHSHPNNLALAKEFFATVSAKYKNLPNVIYEIWNEPLEIEWSECKAYAEEVIPVIRKNAPRSIILVGTPRWDQEVDKAAADPLQGQTNIMYTLHFYAATHKQYLRDIAEKALADGLPLFISECAAMEASGDGVIAPSEWNEWIQLADRHKISWAAWSVSDKVETCSMLYPGAPTLATDWTEDWLKPWAVLVRHYLAVDETK